MILRKYSVLFLCLFALVSFGQNQDQEIEFQTNKRCGTDAYMEELMQDPEFVKDFERRQREIDEKIKSGNRVNCGGNPVVIPVAVHYGSEFNLSNTSCLIDKALEQIQVLNEDFGGYNFDITNYCEISEACPADYPPDAITQGSCIEFCLASNNHPAGEDVVGGYAITVGDYNGSSAPAWSGYCNFFVRDLGGGLLGVAPLSGAANPNGNGARVTSGAWGGAGGPCTSGSTLDNLSPYNLGRTATHELGHYFGLFHVFDGCGSGDGIADTPSQNTENFGCPSVNTNNCTSTSINSCGTQDFWFNFMDYVNDACMWMFTEDQSVKMYNTVGNFASGKCGGAGTYNPTYPDGCGAVVEPLGGLVLDFVDLLCFEDYSGTIFLTVNGGILPYTITVNSTSYGDYWDTNIEVNNLPGGSLFIEIEDASGQYITLNQFLDEPDELVVFIESFDNLTCFENMSGSIVADAFGGSPNYMYSIDGVNFQASGEFTGLGADGFTITVLDNNDCEVEVLQEIEEPVEIGFAAQDIVPVSCFNGNNGSIEVLSNGGTPSYTYHLVELGESNTTGLFENLETGEYIIKVVDGNSCVLLDTLIVNEPDSLYFTSSFLTEIACNGDAGATLLLDGVGGTENYEFEIAGIGTSTDGEFSEIAAGTYNGVVIDANDCIAEAMIVVAEPDTLTLNTTQIVNVNCGDNNDGIVSLIGGGGVPGYMYSADGINYQMSESFTGLGEGNYTFYVQDLNGCEKTLDVAIIQESDLSIDITNQVDAACLGDFSGTIQAEGSNGAGELQYTLNSEMNNTGLFENLTIGTYTLTVEDENGCTSQLEIDIESSSTLALALDDKIDITCNGLDNGMIQVSGLDGAGSYEYSIDGTNFSTTNSFEGLIPGEYEVYVQDANGCQIVQEVEILEPEVLAVDLLDKNDISCFGESTGTINISGQGGTGVLNFGLAGSTNQNGEFSDLPSDNYEITVTDENGCSESIMVDLTQPAEITYQLSNEILSNCDGDPIGAFTITAEGGVGGFSYELAGNVNSDGVFVGLGAGTYPVIITDANDCSTTENIIVSSASDIEASLESSNSPSCPTIEDGQVVITVEGGTGIINFTLDGVTNTTGIFDDLGAGEYVVILEDELGCQTSVDVTIDEPSEISPALLDMNDALCFGSADGSVTLDAQGGTGQISYTLEGETNTSGLFENILSGDYTATVSDENNCTMEISFTIDQPTQITSQIEAVAEASCFGISDGSVEVSGAGGTGNIDFLYNNISYTDGMIDGLASGEIEITLIDENGCFIKTNATIDQPDEIMIELQSLFDNVCFGENEGQVSVLASGGNGTFTYGLDSDANATGIFTGLQAGNYEVMVEDAKGCTSVYNFDINDPAQISVSLLNQSIDNGTANGSAQFSGAGGTTPYQYSINGGLSSQASGSFTNLEAGEYELLITDSEGCTNTINFSISLQELPDDKNIINAVTRPNPTDRFLTLVFESHGDQHVDLYFYDITGKHVATYGYEAISGQNIAELDFGPDIPIGVYVLYVKGEVKEFPLEIVISK
jgi:hypothetical protein